MKRTIAKIALGACIGFAAGAVSIVSQPHSGKSQGKLSSSPGVNTEISIPESPAANALAGVLYPSWDLRTYVGVSESLRTAKGDDYEKILDSMEGQSADPYEKMLPLFKEWLAKDLTGASEWMRKRADNLGRFGDLGAFFSGHGIGNLIFAWAEADREGAIAYARAHPTSGITSELLRVALYSAQPADYPQNLEEVLRLPPSRTRRTVLHEFHRQWAAVDPAAALASVKALQSDEERALASTGLIYGLVPKDPAMALEMYKELALADSEPLTAILSRLGATNPDIAIKALAGLPVGEPNRHMVSILDEWIQKDTAAALTWALENNVRLGLTSRRTISADSRSAGRQAAVFDNAVMPIMNALERNPQGTVAWIDSLPPGPAKERMVRIASMYATDPQSALPLFNMLPPDSRAAAANSVVMSMKGDLQKAQEWALNLADEPSRLRAIAGLGKLPGPDLDLPPGQQRDAFLSGRATRSGLRIPERLGFISSIQDPVLRQDTFEEVMENHHGGRMSREELDAAFDEAKIPEEWRRRWWDNVPATK